MDANELIVNYIERIERLNEEKKSLSEDIRDIFAEAKSHGLDTKAMREVLRKRKMDAAARTELENLEAAYSLALGMK